MPAWLAALSSSAVAGWDFTTNDQFRVSQASFARALEAYMLDATPTYDAFAVNTLRRIAGAFAYTVANIERNRWFNLVMEHQVERTPF